ncbi:MAG: HU family DNA-binding protein, partial [Thiogranum sp.]
TGEAVALAAKYVPHFKPGKELRERVNIYGRGDETGDAAAVSGESASPAGERSLF